ncbi:MAG: FeoB-associated Cys-rich membrane protein [Candidatus Humimicrobiaceae bacterium]
MSMIIEIILIALIVAGALIYFFRHLRKELKGNSSCSNACSSCKIKEDCRGFKAEDETQNTNQGSH